MIITEYIEKINSFDDDWQDIKTESPVINIRVKGTYPKQKVKHHHHVAHPHIGFLPCFNQHKPYGLATVHIQFHDDRPDWYRFHAEKKKRYFEEITGAKLSSTVFTILSSIPVDKFLQVKLLFPDHTKYPSFK